MEANNQFLYDVFVSHSTADRAWVEEHLLARLHNAKLKVAAADQFEVGADKLSDIERLVLASRRVIVVLSPNWLQTEMKDFDVLLARNLDPSASKRKLLPLQLKPCEIPRAISSLRLSVADVTNASHAERELQRITRDVRDAIPVPLPISRVSGVGSVQQWLRWLQRYRRQVRLGLVAAFVSVLAVLMLAQWGPFQPRLGWQAVGSIPVKGGKLLARAHTALFIATFADLTACRSDTGLWRSTDDGRTWVSISIPNPRPKTECQRSEITAFAYSPAATQTIYASTAEVGLLRSDKGGEAGSWFQVAPKITASLAISNLHSVAVSPQDVNQVFVATQSHEGVYRSIDGGSTWQRLDAVGTCTTAGLDSLPANLDVRLLLTSGTQLLAATNTSDPRPSLNSGIYLSADNGNCWRLLDDAQLQYAYDSLTALPGSIDQWLTVTSDKILPSDGSDRYALWRVRQTGGRDTRPLHIFVQALPTVYIEPGATPGEPPQWYAATFDGVIVRSILDGTDKIELLPPLIYCIPWPPWELLKGDACSNVYMAPQSLSTTAPLMLVRDRLYKLGMVPWYNAILPQTP